MWALLLYPDTWLLPVPCVPILLFLWPLNLEALYVHSQMIPICPLLGVTSLRVIQGLLSHHTCMRTLTLNPSTFGSPQYSGLTRTLGHLLWLPHTCPLWGLTKNDTSKLAPTHMGKQDWNTWGIDDDSTRTVHHEEVNNNKKDQAALRDGHRDGARVNGALAS